MINWVLLGIFVLVGLVLLKMEHHGKKVKLVILVFAGLLIYFSVHAIFNSSDLDLSSPRGILNAVYVYFGWLGKTLSSLWDVGVQTTGRVIEAVNLSVHN